MSAVDCDCEKKIAKTFVFVLLNLLMLDAFVTRTHYVEIYSRRQCATLMKDGQLSLISAVSYGARGHVPPRFSAIYFFSVDFKTAQNLTANLCGRLSLRTFHSL